MPTSSVSPTPTIHQAPKPVSITLPLGGGGASKDHPRRCSRRHGLPLGDLPLRAAPLGLPGIRRSLSNLRHRRLRGQRCPLGLAQRKAVPRSLQNQCRRLLSLRRPPGAVWAQAALRSIQGARRGRNSPLCRQLLPSQHRLGGVERLPKKAPRADDEVLL